MPEIRRAVSDDAESIARVHVASWQAAYRGIVPADHLAGLQWRTRYEFWAGELTAPSIVGSSTWVLLEGPRVLGFVAVGPGRDADPPSADTWELYALYLSESQWGRALGRALTEAALAAVPEAANAVSLWVLADNQRARRFYERQGFTADGRERVIRLGGRRLRELRYVLLRAG